MSIQTMTATALEIKSMRNNPLPHLRGMRVKRLASRLRKMVVRILSAWNREAVARIRQGKEPIAVDAVRRWSEQFYREQRGMMGMIAFEGAKTVQSELGFGTKSASTTAIAAPTDDDGEDRVDLRLDFTQHGYQEPVDEWLREVASPATKRHANRIAKLYKESTEYEDDQGRGLTQGEVARRVEKLSTAFVPSRARMIAYTNANWAFNSGARKEYTSLGVTAFEWMTTEDDATCPFCRAMDGVIVGQNAPFWHAGSNMQVAVGEGVRNMNLKYGVMHPPLHPNCGCVLLPVVTQPPAPTMPHAPDDLNTMIPMTSEVARRRVSRKISDAAKAIRGLEYERVVILDAKTGNTLAEINGTENSVKIEKKEHLYHCIGNIVMHNHPTHAGPSHRDIICALGGSARENIIVTPNAAYHIVVKKKPLVSTKELEELVTGEYTKAYRQARREVTQELYNEGVDVLNPNPWYHHGQLRVDERAMSILEKVLGFAWKVRYGTTGVR